MCFPHQSSGFSDNLNNSMAIKFTPSFSLSSAAYEIFIHFSLSQVQSPVMHLSVIIKSQQYSELAGISWCLYKGEPGNRVALQNHTLLFVAVEFAVLLQPYDLKSFLIIHKNYRNLIGTWIWQSNLYSCMFSQYYFWPSEIMYKNTCLIAWEYFFHL